MFIYQQQSCFINSRCNFIRCTQLILCSASGTLAVSNYLTDQKFLLIYLLIFLTSASHGLITFIDIVSRCTLGLNIQFKLWTMYAFTATLMFVSSAVVYGMYLGVKQTMTASLVIALFLVSAVFTWDAVCILLRVRVEPLSEVIRKQHTEEVSGERKENEEKQINESTPSDTTVDFGRTSKKNRRKPTTISYGGTFHVSKDTVPLPSPMIDENILPQTANVSLVSITSTKERKKQDTKIEIEDYLISPNFL